MVEKKKLVRAKLDQNPRDQESYDWLTEDDLVDILRGLDPGPPRRRRRRGDSGGGAGVVVISPSSIAIFDNVVPGTTIATISVAGGTGTYTYTLTDPSGQFTIVGNQLRTATPVIAGSFPITITASNGVGDNPTLTTTITVAHFTAAYVPTYYIYGF